MTAPAEIKTKLTADGSELSRALDKGIAKTADFRKRAEDLGKSIGRAFTVTFAVRGFNEAMKHMDELIAKERELVRARLEQNKSDVKTEADISGAKTSDDLKAVREKIEAEVAAIQARMNELDFPTFGEKVKDIFEAAFTGEATASDVEKAALQKRLNELIQKAKEIREKAKETGKSDEVKATEKSAKDDLIFLDAIKNAEQDLNRMRDEAIAKEAEKLDLIRKQADEALEQNFGNESAARNLLMGFLPEQDTRRSSLVRIGANEIGSGARAQAESPAAIADKLATKVGAKIEETTRAVKNLVMGIFQ